VKTQVFKWSGNIPGYGAATPEGDVAVLIDGTYIATSRGRVALPSNDAVGFIDVHDGGKAGLLITGSGQRTDQAWLRTYGHWTAIAPVAYGMAPCRFNPALNEVWVATNGSQAKCVSLASLNARIVPADTGSQGFAYAKADGTMVNAWTVYINTKIGLCVYTDFGHVAIGQSLKGDSIVVRFADDGILRLLATGRLRNTVAKWDGGSKFGIVYVNYAGHETTAVWATEAELRALKPVVATPTAPPQPPAPPVPPKPPTEPKPLTGITDAQFATLERVRAQYPPTGLSPGEIGAILNEVAWVHRAEGVGMQAKPSGTAATQPRTGTSVWNGMRFVVDGKHIGQDVLIGAAIGTATPGRGEPGLADPASFVHPVEPIFTEVPPVIVVPPPAVPPAVPPVPPVVVPPTPPPTVPDLVAKVDAILAGVVVLATTLKEVAARLDAIKAEADADAADLGLTHAVVVGIDAQLKRGFKSRYLGDITPKE
jgi:hypothetical protein